MKQTSQRSLLFRQNVNRTEAEWVHFLARSTEWRTRTTDAAAGGLRPARLSNFSLWTLYGLLCGLLYGLMHGLIYGLSTVFFYGHSTGIPTAFPRSAADWCGLAWRVAAHNNGGEAPFKENYALLKKLSEM